MPLSRDDILKMNDAQVEVIAVPAWTLNGETARVCIKTLSVDEAEHLEKIASAKPLVNFLQECCVAFVCDKDGKPLFRPVDIQALSAKSARALKTITERGLKFNGMDTEAVSRAEKNSEATPSEDSGSPSPPT